MASELIAHHREQFRGKILFSLTGKSSHQGKAHYRRRYSLFNPFERRPATLSRVGNEWFHAGELLIASKYIGRQIEQPTANDASVAP